MMLFLTADLQKINKAEIKWVCKICFFHLLGTKILQMSSAGSCCIVQWLGPPHRRLDKHIQNNREGSIRPRFHAVFSFQNISVKMIFCPGYFLFFLAIFGGAMSEIIGKFHGLWTPGEEIVFTARPKIHSHSQFFRYGRSIFCLPYLPNFSDIYDLCLHWVSVVHISI